MPLDGVLHYSMSASEVVQFGYYGPGEVTHSTIALSGDVAYTAKSECGRSAWFLRVASRYQINRVRGYLDRYLEHIGLRRG